MDKKEKVVVGLSGGIDSTVALLLLKKQGFEPIGISLRYAAWQGENLYSNKESFKIAKKICQKLKVPYQIIDCRKEFKEKVIGYFINELKQKRTPNPCIICNHQLKFKNLLDFAKKKNIRYVATGHYARIEKKGNQYQLLKGKDKDKDQSYFLCLLAQKELKDIIFPLGNLTKKEVCQIAKKNKLNLVLKRKQSQDLCFIDKTSLTMVLEKEVGIEQGEIVDNQGNVLGKHKGLHFYTIGQRKGLDIPKGPWWVIGFNKEKNQLVVTNKEKDINLFSKIVFVSHFNFISGQLPKKIIKVKVQLRYLHKPALAELSIKGDQIELNFKKPQKAATPGQWAVFFQKDICLGGGIISQSWGTLRR